jgi:uncharacterized protein YuzE
MKFEYDVKNDDRECVAYITADGRALVIRDRYDDCIYIDYADKFVGTERWNPDKATHKFYPGDKLTITF